MTPTPSAREPQDHIADAGNMVEPQDIIVTPEWIAGVRINWGLDRMTPGDAAQHWYEVSNGAGVPCGIVAALGHTLDAYDALAAERDSWKTIAAHRGFLLDTVKTERDTEREMREASDRERAAVLEQEGRMGLQIMDLERERDAMAAEVARRDALSAEAMRLFSSLTACTGIERALAEDAIEQRRRAAAAERELDALRGDAERWRYVRDHGYVVTMGVTLPSGEQVGGGRVGDGYATGCVDAMMALDRKMLDAQRGTECEEQTNA